MLTVCLSASEISALRQIRFYHPHPKVQVRADVLLLRNEGLSNDQIVRITGISVSTLIRYLKLYNQGGIEEIKKLHYEGQKSELLDYKETLEEYFKEHPVASIKQAADIIEKITGIRRKPTQIRKFLKDIGMTLRKVGSIPSKGDPEKQEAFRKTELEPRLQEAREGTRVVFFVDAAHFVLAPFLGLLWCFARVFIKAPSGRKRFNVLGAINAVTHELITVTNDTYINAHSFCDLLWQIGLLNITVPVTLVLDNAKYQKCRIVFVMAEFLGIELLYLPSYSPNLNIIERLWKFVKKEALYSQYHSNFSDFKAAICRVLEQTHTTYKKELDSLLTLRFQTFKNVQVVSL